MTRGNHHTDSLTIQFSRAQGCQQPNAIDNRVKQRAESIISRSVFPHSSTAVVKGREGKGREEEEGTKTLTPSCGTRRETDKPLEGSGSRYRRVTYPSSAILKRAVGGLGEFGSAGRNCLTRRHGDKVEETQNRSRWGNQCKTKEEGARDWKGKREKERETKIR